MMKFDERNVLYDYGSEFCPCSMTCGCFCVEKKNFSRDFCVLERRLELPLKFAVCPNQLQA